MRLAETHRCGGAEYAECEWQPHRTLVRQKWQEGQLRPVFGLQRNITSSNATKSESMHMLLSFVAPSLHFALLFLCFFQVCSSRFLLLLLAVLCHFVFSFSFFRFLLLGVPTPPFRSTRVCKCGRGGCACFTRPPPPFDHTGCKMQPAFSQDPSTCARRVWHLSAWPKPWESRLLRMQF